MIAVRHPTSAAEVYANAAAVRKRLFSPQKQPVKRAEPVEAAVTRIYMTAPTERVWTAQHDAHMAAFYEWKGNEPLGYLKMRCRELDIAYEVMVSTDRAKWLIGPRHMLVLEIKERYPNLSNPRIAAMFNRDHTLINAIRRKAPPTTASLDAKRELDDQIERMARKGFSQASIAKTLGIATKAVNHVFFQRKLHPDRGPSLEDNAEAIRLMFNLGMSQREICLELGHSKTGMSKFIKRMGWKR